MKVENFQSQMSTKINGHLCEATEGCSMVTKVINLWLLTEFERKHENHNKYYLPDCTNTNLLDWIVKTMLS